MKLLALCLVFVGADGQRLLAEGYGDERVHEGHERERDEVKRDVDERVVRARREFVGPLLNAIARVAGARLSHHGEERGGEDEAEDPRGEDEREGAAGVAAERERVARCQETLDGDEDEVNDGEAVEGTKDEIVDLAENGAIVPVVLIDQHRDVEGSEDGEEEIGKGEVREKVVYGRPHVRIEEDGRDDEDVAQDAQAIDDGEEGFVQLDCPREMIKVPWIAKYPLSSSRVVTA